MLGKGLSLYISGVASIFFPSLFSYLYTGSWTGRQTQFNNAFQLILKHSKKKNLQKYDHFEFTVLEIILGAGCQSSLHHALLKHLEDSKKNKSVGLIRTTRKSP